MTPYAEIVLPLPLDQTFTYIIPASLQDRAKVGVRVLVPFGKRQMTGFLVGLKKRLAVQNLELKEIQEVLDGDPVFEKSFLEFTRKLSDYYHSAWGELLEGSIPSSLIFESQKRLSLSDPDILKSTGSDLSEAETKILDALSDKPYSAAYLRRKLRIKNLSYWIGQLEEKGRISVSSEMRRTRRRKAIPPSLGESQLEIDFSLDRKTRSVSESILKRMEKEPASGFLLYGIREKREAVYLELMRHALEAKKTVLFLVPEIASIGSFLGKLENKLGERAAILHSRLSEAKREREWQRIGKGEASVVLGPRSALFSPLLDLGLIIIDEEQDESYYQTENPTYDARQGARLRGRLERAPVVYGSDAPTVEGFFRAKKRSVLFELEGSAGKRRVEFLVEQPAREVVSQKLKMKIRSRMRRGEPTVVFSNRRGYAPLVSCARCHHIPRCSECDISLTFHKKDNRLICHYCNSAVSISENCPKCGGRIAARRGVGIEAVEEDLMRAFPEARIVGFDLDRTRRKADQDRILEDFRLGKIDVLIGTKLLAHQGRQLQVGFLAILHPEQDLAFADFRASQRAFQDLRRMMGLLKDSPASEAVIQTLQPDHHSIRCAALDDYSGFYEREIQFRRLMNYPPFSYLVEILFQGESLRVLGRQSRNFIEAAKNISSDIEVMGPALASVAKIRGRRRVQIVLKANRKAVLDTALHQALRKVRVRKTVHLYE